MCHRLIMTHSSVPEDQRKKLGISENMIRLSVGIEDVEDLLDGNCFFCFFCVGWILKRDFFLCFYVDLKGAFSVLSTH